MSWRLAKRGHDVIVYAPIKKTTKSPWRDVKWLHFKRADFKLKGTWIIYRVPEILAKLSKIDQKIWFLWQDWDYPTLTPKLSKRADKHITLCKSHGKYILRKYPYIRLDQLWLSSNGIKLDLIEETEKKKIIRNPKRIMYASSPDRGLLTGLRVFKKAREYIPDLEFYAFYGFNNLDKLLKGFPNSTLAKNKVEIMKLIDLPGVHFEGRINQPQLMEEWFKSGIYLYITNFFETSHISGMEAQACGAVPVFSPVYAQKENIKNGIGVMGDATDDLTIARAAVEVVRLALDTKLQDQFRVEMMPWARERFDWEVFVSQWEFEARNMRDSFEGSYDFPEQL